MNGNIKKWLTDHLLNIIVLIFMAGVMWSNVKNKVKDFDVVAKLVNLHDTKIQLLEKDILYIKSGVEEIK